MGGVSKPRLRVERSIYQSQHTNLYVVQINRPHKGGQFFAGNIVDIEEAREIRDEFKRLNPPQSQKGLNNNCFKGDIKPSKLRNFMETKRELRQNSVFYCNRCEQDKDIKYLNLHHIDHNRDNDNIENFEVLCTTCHREHHNLRDSKGRFR